MKQFLAHPFMLLTLLLCMANHAYADSADESKWLACEKDSDCISIELGCWYWQPVNAQYSDAMLAKHIPVCTASFPPGPKPTTSCKNHQCINNPYTVKDWKLIAPGNGFVYERLTACFKSADIPLGWLTPELSKPFFTKVNTLMSTTYSGDTPIETVVEAAIPCAEVVAAANALKNKR